MRITARHVPVIADPVRLLHGASNRDVVWLDSALPEDAPAGAGDRARWSVVAFCDGPFGAEFVHESRIGTCTAADAAAPWFGGCTGSSDRPAFELLERLLAATPRVGEPIAGCGFALGWVGYLGYELGRESGGPDRVADGHPDAHLRFVDRAVVIDHRDGVSWVLAIEASGQDAASATNRAWADHMAVRIATGRRTDAIAPDATPSLQTVGAAVGRVRRAAYETAVDACREEIRDGNAFQVCLTTAFAVPTDRAEARPADTTPLRTGGPNEADGLLAYVRMRTADPVPFGCYLRLGSVEVLGRSPERFLRIDAGGRMTAEPIKGTRPRGADPMTDRLLRDGLRSSAKDRAENVMIVDLLRNDLSRTAEPGSVRVERLCEVETYAGVHQLVSTVSGVLPEHVSRAAVVRAAFPPGSMTGAPKISAMAIADRLERAPRGVYSGAIGYFSASGAVDLAVTIRSLVTVRVPDGGVRSRTLGAGGAVTWSSSSSQEADEVEAKTRSVLGAVGAVAVW